MYSEINRRQPFETVVLLVKGEPVYRGKTAIREFEARRKIREDMEVF